MNYLGVTGSKKEGGRGGGDLVPDHKWRLKLSLGMLGVEKRWESKPGLLVRNKIQMTSTDLVRSFGVDGFLKRKKKKNI